MSKIIGPSLPQSVIDSGERIIGPTLPPNLSIQEDQDESPSEKVIVGPALPPSFKASKTESSDAKIYIGPTLPPSFQKEASETKCENQNDTIYIGPALPPSFKTSEASSLYGPPLPPDYKPESSKSTKSVIGPALPPGFSLPVLVEKEDSSSEDEYIGPSLTLFQSSEKNDESVSKSFERRAKKMKDKLLHQEEVVQKREDWMTQLPDVLSKKIGVGARTFSKRSGPSASDIDRSGWTETPQDKERKDQQMEENGEEEYRKPTPEEIATYSRNLNIKSKIDEFNKTKRKDTLLDIHKKNLKRKAKESNEKTEKRREFDRDKDLNIQKLDKDGANNIIARSKVFNSKFSHGSNHFL